MLIFGLSSVLSGREDFGIRVKKKTSVPSVDQRSVCFVCVVPKETYKMVRMNARLIPTTEKMGLCDFRCGQIVNSKHCLGEQMDLIVTEKG